MSVFVFVESFDGKANNVSWEALGAASRISSDITAIAFGKNAAAIAQEAGH